MGLTQEFEEFEDVFLNASIGIIFVNADGVIIYANPYELKELGYTEDEYVGHNACEFQVGGNVISDVMARLNNKEILVNYPISVKAKQGVKYFLLNSSAYTQDDKFVHSRCFSSNISKSVYDVFVTHSEYYN